MLSVSTIPLVTSPYAPANYPNDMIFDNSNNMYIADSGNNCIRKITTSGVVSTFAGNGYVGITNGIGTSATFNYPKGLTIDPSGQNLYIADATNNCIRQINISSKQVTTLAGSITAGSADGIGTSAQFNGPSGITIDPSG
jgi:sugar lactone lactonase YvrE